MRRNYLLRVFIMATLVFLFVYPSLASKKVIRVGYFPNVTHAQPLVGVASGDFARGIDGQAEIETYLFNAGPSAMEALLAGRLDLVYVGPNPALNTFIRSNGRALRILAGACSGGAALVLQKELKITSPAQLDGKRLATPQLGNTQDIALRCYLKEYGLKPKENGGKVSIFPISNSDILLLFKRGEIDGAWTVEPWVSRLVMEAGGYIYQDESELWPNGVYPITYLVGSADFIRHSPDLVQRWVQTHLAVTKKLEADPEQTVFLLNKEMAKWIGAPLPEALLKSAFDRLELTCAPMREEFLVMAERAFSLGFVKKTVDPGAAFDLSFLETALAIEGQ